MDDASSHGAPVLLLVESKHETYRATGGLKKLVRRLRAHYDVQVCVNCGGPISTALRSLRSTRTLTLTLTLHVRTCRGHPNARAGTRRS